MKKKIITGVMVIILVVIVILGLKNSLRKSYEFYDMEGNKGTSTKCKLKETGAYCETSKGWKLVSQYSEVSK